MTTEVLAARGADGRRARAVVVGAGVSGLVVAHDLARAGVQVAVLEAESIAGGRLRRARLGEHHLDIGAEAFATRGGSVQRLLEELQIEDRVVRPARLGAWTVGERHALPLPEAGVLGVPSHPLSRSARSSLGLRGALRASIDPILPRRIGSRSGSVAELVRTRLGRRALDRLVAPVVRGVYSLDPDRLPVAAVPKLGAAIERHGSIIAASREVRADQSAAGGAVATLDGGMTVLVEALLRGLELAGGELRAGERAVSLERRPLTIVTQSKERFPADVIVLAVAESAARALLGLPVPESGIETPVEVIALHVDDARLDAAPRGTGVLVAEGSSASAKALTHVTAKWPHLSLPANEHVLRLSYGRAGRPPETEGLSDEAAAALALADASRLLGLDLRPETLRAAVRHRWHNGLPPTPERRIDPIRGVLLAGDWLSGSGLASVIPAARNTARQALRYLNTRSASEAGSDTEGAPDDLD